MPERGILEPKDTFDRFLYLILSILTPNCILAVYPQIDDDLFLVTMVMWWIITTYWTVKWLAGVIEKRVKKI